VAEANINGQGELDTFDLDFILFILCVDVCKYLFAAVWRTTLRPG